MVETSADPKEETQSPKRLNAADRRRQLLRVAKKLFAQNGYKLTTTANIAKAANVTEPILYRHFRSKKNLFLEVINEIRRETLDQWRRMAEVHPGDPLETLRMIAKSFQTAKQTHGLEYRVTHRALAEVNDREIAQMLRAFYCDEADFFAQVIQRGQEAGRFRTDVDAQMAAWSFIRQAMAYSLTEPLEIPLYQDPDHYRRLVELTFSILLPPSGQ
ncbi:MAG: TetR/AcrR family transcriptional regulator [Phycisphaerae bacterium]|nr:TetR/AcrR family transcriptional regulator [Phycisphaerae bacterium]